MDIQISSLEDPLWQRQHSFEHFQRQSGDAKHAIDGPKIFLVSLFYDSSMHVSKGFLIIFMLLLPPFMPPPCAIENPLFPQNPPYISIFSVCTQMQEPVEDREGVWSLELALQTILRFWCGPHGPSSGPLQQQHKLLVAEWSPSFLIQSVSLVCESLSLIKTAWVNSGRMLCTKTQSHLSMTIPLIKMTPLNQ